MTIDPLLLVAALPVLAAVGWRIRVTADALGYKRGFAAGIVEGLFEDEMPDLDPGHDVDRLNAMHRPPRCS